MVSYGVLNLLLVDGNEEDFKKVYEFSKSVGLPTKLKDLEFDSSQLEEIAKIAVEMKDIDHNPYKIQKKWWKSLLENWKPYKNIKNCNIIVYLVLC